MRRLLSTLAITGSLLIGVPTIAVADGLVLFGGVKSGNQLSYRFDFGGDRNSWDRLRLRIGPKKMKLAAMEFIVRYPHYFKGSFDPDKVEVRVGGKKGKKVPLSEVKWDKDNHVIQIYPEEPVPAGKKVELVFSNMRTSNSGIYYFQVSIQSPGDVPLARYVGTSVVSVN
ncbi:MAG: DUF2808 domain-containing protein [Nostocaceae cyanobacterium]|nr:DUF2808 domain-containing protein [Nostocaceae cyanobacterium]